jgi:predicted DNA-binding transcriptional regulator AlpA
MRNKEMAPSAWNSKDIDKWLRDRIAAAGQDPSVVEDKPLQILKIKDVKERTKLGRSTIYRQIALGRFPAPFHLIN